MLDKQMDQAERLRDEMEIELKRLSVSDRESMLASAEILKDSSDYVRRIYERFLLRESELNALKSAGLAKEHPKIKHYQSQVTDVQQVLQKAIVKEIEAFQARKNLQDKRVEELKKRVSSNQADSTNKARLLQEFNIAREEYQSAVKAKEQMAVRYDTEKTKIKIPAKHVIVHDTPEQSGVPVTRGREFVATLATVCSLPFAIGLGIMLMYLAELALPRRG
ncbi:MAG: hypothetical protein HKP20_09400 [Akkermansiaceae bacterium]|nr:hypothetical protein [Akkermansiaceae bacterium]